MTTLEYENQILLDIVHQDELAIFAKGIAIERILQNLFSTYASESNLVFVLSASQAEEKFYLKNIGSSKVVSITTEYSAAERKELYNSGGVFFVTSRILVVDFLKDVVPADKITGVVVLRAHNVIESSQEAFILRLYRSKNKTGFIKAFSCSPTSFLLGYSKVSRVMRCCFLANLSLWPRFHSLIKESLTPKNSPSVDDVIEIQLHLTKEMKDIQTNLLDLVNLSVSEIKRTVPALNDEEISVETALTKGFEKIVSAYMDPVWNTISAKSKEVMNELKLFRMLLTQLTKFDCVSFYSSLCMYTSHDAAFKSSWVLSKAAENIITAAKSRLCKTSSGKKKSVDFFPEIPSKWLALSEILNEIVNDEKLESSNIESSLGSDVNFGAKLKTVIFAEDNRTCSILKDYLTTGSEATLAKIARNSENIRPSLPPELLVNLHEAFEKTKSKKKPKGAKASSEEKANTTVEEEVQVTLTQMQRKYEDVEFLQTPVFIRAYRSLDEMGPFSISEWLNELKPDVIILFDASLDLVRSIETYRARHVNLSLKVYFLVFHNSVEEQIYLTSIQREKVAFEKLIEEKSTMVVPQEREAKDDLNQDLWRDPKKANETVSTSGTSRRNMQQDDKAQQVVLVDMREFRSELPSLVHKRGIDLEPITLDVGDYILTPDICVERKSISDLIGSLNSGRLYKQAEAMGRHYKKPVLLIEQEQATNVSGTMRNRKDLEQIMPKLLLLTIHFPKLRIIWSPGAHYTAEIFHELKTGKPQPDPNEALSVQKEAVGSHSSSKFNPSIHSLLSKLPGIDSRNVYFLLNKYKNLEEIINLSVEELSITLENTATAKLFHDALHGEHFKGVSESSSKPGPSKLSKFKR